MKPNDYNKLRKKHPLFLKKLNHKCQFCGKCGLSKGSGKRYNHYNFHHSNSEAYGRERPGRNYLLLCKKCHWFVHFLGGEVILRKGNITRQNHRAKKLGFGMFPNLFQNIFNTISFSFLDIFQVSILTVVAFISILFLS